MADINLRQWYAIACLQLLLLAGFYLTCVDGLMVPILHVFPLPLAFWALVVHVPIPTCIFQSLSLTLQCLYVCMYAYI